jgi:uncharacterized membrane protein YdbT with pleckstrin-like domain
MPGEQVVTTARLHWSIFLRPSLFLLISVALLIGSGSASEEVMIWALRIPGLCFLAIALAVGVDRLIRLWTSEYAVTNKRVLVKVGLIRRDSLELLLTKVEAIGVNQGVIGRLLGFGTLVITGTGGSVNSYPKIGSPLGFRRAVQEQTGTAQNRP